MEKIESYIRLVETTLARQDFEGDPATLYEPVSYILNLGGKRLRPALVLAACELFGGQKEEALMPALGIEMFHNFSLIHDDIMDRAPLRRGRPTVHKKWNENTAILSGDVMLVKAYQYMAEVDPGILPGIIKNFSRTAVEVCEGQQYDMIFETSAHVSEEDYLEMIRLKTSVLLGCALKTGALVARAPQREADTIYKFGVNIGIAFQIKDDILDTYGNEQEVGKQPGGDILNDKRTLLMIYALEQSDELKKWLGRDKDNTTKLTAVRRIFDTCGARAYAEEKMKFYYHSALEELNRVKGNEDIKKELITFSQYLMARQK